MPDQKTTPAEPAAGQVWRPRRKSEQARTITGIDRHNGMVFYTKENGWPHFALTDQFARWAQKVGATP